MKAQQQRAAADVAGNIVPSGHTPLLYFSPEDPSPELSADAAAGDMGMLSLSLRYLTGLVISQRALHMRLSQQWLHPLRGSARMALFFKACPPLLSGVSAYVADRCGRFVAAQGSLSGHVTISPVFAFVDRQERAPFIQQSLLPAMQVGNS